MFFDREEEQKRLFNILNTEPSLLYFIYGPINSGKTNLINKILSELPAPAIPFYVNLRGSDISSSDDFLNVLFRVDRKSRLENAKDYLKEISKGGAGLVKSVTGIPVPASIFDLLFRSKDKGEDAFKYLEDFFTSLVNDKNMKPVFVIDEIQMIRGIANSHGKPVIEKFFNFLVRMTKETHLCHCLSVTSDSLFIEQIHGHARLEGRSEYLLIDDLDKKRSFDVYEKFGLTDKESVWNHIGGKFGDMVILQSKIRQGSSLPEALETMVRAGTARLESIDGRLFREAPQNCQKMIDFLFRVNEEKSIQFRERLMWNEVFFWVNENILFLDPVTRIVKPQGHLMRKAISMFLKNMENAEDGSPEPII